MLSDLRIINPLDIQNWDELILQHPDYSFFHSSYWSKVLQDTYNYKPHYFVIEKDNKLKAAIPVMFVESFITGKRAVSLPFSDYCEPLISEGIDVSHLFDEIIKYSKKEKLNYIELKGWKKYFNQIDPSAFKYTHNLSLNKNKDELFSNFRKGTKSSIKKAIREGVTVKIDNSLTSVEEYCLMNSVTRKRHGLPPQPNSLFRNLHKHIIAKDLGFVSLANFNGQNIAGAIYLNLGKKALYKYSASYHNYLYLMANNLVMWESIKYCIDKKYEVINFGITEPSNEGLRRYKAGWGTEESLISIYRYNLNERSFVPINSKVTGFHNKIFNKTPIPVLKIFSSIFYKHFG